MHEMFIKIRSYLFMMILAFIIAFLTDEHIISELFAVLSIAIGASTFYKLSALKDKEYEKTRKTNLN